MHDTAKKKCDVQQLPSSSPSATQRGWLRQCAIAVGLSLGANVGEVEGVNDGSNVGEVEGANDGASVLSQQLKNSPVYFAGPVEIGHARGQKK